MWKYNYRYLTGANKYITQAFLVCIMFNRALPHTLLSVKLKSVFKYSKQSSAAVPDVRQISAVVKHEYGRHGERQVIKMERIMYLSYGI